MVAYNGASWWTPVPDADLVFRVLGAEDTGDQILTMLQRVDSYTWANGVEAVTTGVEANQYRDGENYAIDELVALLNIGTSTGGRLLAEVTAGKYVHIYTKPAESTVRLVWRGGTDLVDVFGQSTDDGFLPHGEWVKLGDQATLGPWAALSPVFVERAEYRVGTGWVLEPEGVENIWDVGVQQG